MTDNIVVNDNETVGKTLATKELSHGGDTANVQVIEFGIITGSEGSYSLTEIVGGSGVLTPGVQRIAIATDDINMAAIKTAVEGTLTVDNGGTFAVQSTLQAGTAEIGKLAAGTAEIGSVKWAGTAPPIGAGTEAAALRVTLATNSTGLLSVDDNGGSLTIDNSTLAVVGGGTEAAAMRVTIASDTTGVLSVDDNGASLTIDNAQLELLDDVIVTLGTDTYTETTSKGSVISAVRNDALATLADTDNEFTPLQVDAMGALWVNESPNVVDSNNSTTSTLTSGSAFTGTGVDVLHYNNITIQLDASHDSATDGIQIQSSIDNTNWDFENTFTYTAANGARNFQVAAHAQFFRVVYTNGGTNQTHFRMQVVLSHGTPITTIHRLVDDTSPDRSCIITKSAIIAQAAGSGDFVAVQATSGGNIKVAVEEFDTSLPAGTNNIGDVDVLTTVTPTPQTSGGLSMFKDIDLDETAGGSEVKGSAGQLYGIFATNNGSAVAFLKVYNSITVTVGTTVPDLTFPIPPSDGGLFVQMNHAVAFGTGITLAATNLVADNDATAPAGGANQIVANVFFK